MLISEECVVGGGGAIRRTVAAFIGSVSVATRTFTRSTHSRRAPGQHRRSDYGDSRPPLAICGGPRNDDLIFECSAAGRSLIQTSNRSAIDWYPLFPNPGVAESVLGRLIDTSGQVFMKDDAEASLRASACNNGRDGDRVTVS